MKLEIVSPEAVLFSGEVTSVSVPGIDGEFQMLNNHAPIVSILTKGDVKFSGDNIVIASEFKYKFQQISNTTYHLSISSGTIEMNANKVIVLVN
jgi:F-type H+-transporting ATPase subunit epsilon